MRARGQHKRACAVAGRVPSRGAPLTFPLEYERCVLRNATNGGRRFAPPSLTTWRLSSRRKFKAILPSVRTAANTRHNCMPPPAACAGWPLGRVEPSPGFRARWTRAVEEAARPYDSRQTGAALLGWWRGLLRRNLRPALAVASVWVLVLFFRLSAPGVSLSAQTPMARSPIEIYRALETRERLLATRLGHEQPTRAPRRGRHPAQPRSEGLPPWPTVQSDDEPTVWTI